MVKLNAPCLSLGASGKLGDAIVFASWKGRSYARQLVIPANPRSGGQVGVRSMFKFLSQIWASLTAGKQAEWEDRADDQIISPFNAFVGYNQARWRNFLAPSRDDPATAVATTPTWINETATAGIRQITVSGDIDGAGSHWGVMLFRSTATPVVTSFANCIAVYPAELHQVYRYVDTPLDPDQYYYNWRVFSYDGYLGAEETEVNATVV